MDVAVWGICEILHNAALTPRVIAVVSEVVLMKIAATTHTLCCATWASIKMLVVNMIIEC